MADLHTSEITLRVGLDENRIPESLNWSAQDGGIENEEVKAMLLSVWDSKNQESLKIDLWTKGYACWWNWKLFSIKTLVSLTDYFLKATQDEKMTATWKISVIYFAENLNLKE